MPLYNLACRETLSADVQAKVAEAITDTHSGETGAPRHFVNVMFVDGYPLPDDQIVSVLGGVRSRGRFRSRRSRSHRGTTNRCR